eukprot:TRINITY_DN2840_c0_g1_i1.p1 TRINITY_DN2840_c0_g1~~TRINITY_DN2840_c0_g1_i1.p1  ORF type:complete len:173 (-),score=40.96 TRINITY_DN2840_c0_g1_i1:45-563(-)
MLVSCVELSHLCFYFILCRPKDEVDISGLTEIPFQVQLLYTKPDGATLLRVCAATVTATSNREQAERTADAHVVGGHWAQHAARLAKEGNYEEAQLETRAVQRMLLRNLTSDTAEVVEAFTAHTEVLDQALRNARRNEKEGNMLLGQPQSQRQNMRDDETAAIVSNTVTKTL